jgi:hypothetical protein
LATGDPTDKDSLLVRSRLEIGYFDRGRVIALSWNNADSDPIGKICEVTPHFDIPGLVRGIGATQEHHGPGIQHIDNGHSVHAGGNIGKVTVQNQVLTFFRKFKGLEHGGRFGIRNVNARQPKEAESALMDHNGYIARNSYASTVTQRTPIPDDPGMGGIRDVHHHKPIGTSCHAT